ncbi:MAG: methyltransferase family protein [Acidimicrobiales bacterium]
MSGIEIAVIMAWLLFWLYWLASAFSRKRARVAWARELVIRVVLGGVVVFLAQVGALQGYGVRRELWQILVGLTLLLLGQGFAIWARLNIGQNWGSPMSRKEDPDLVTSGPYALVRHPIYSGLVLALVGTATALTWTWLYAAGLATIYFTYSAFVEERYMTTCFPETYPSYKRMTKRFIPFVL